MTNLQWKQSFVDILIFCLAVALSSQLKLPQVSANDETEQVSNSVEEKESESKVETKTPGNKLLIIMMDGFRWDYYEQSKKSLRGFTEFLKDGVQAEWVEPIFPSESYPAWTSISTGLYPESHGILGNYMFDLKRDEIFNLNNEMSTRKIWWWQDAEPLWITATRHNKNAFLHYWSRCDVPFKEIIPHRCTGYRQAPGVEVFRNTLNLAIDNLLKDYQLAMVYNEHLDNVGHQYGPHSAEIKQAMLDLDDVMYDFLDRMADTRLDETLNVIIVSDHGMTWIGEGSGTVYVPIGDYVNSSYVNKVLGAGTMMSIHPYNSRINEVYENLKGKRGFDVYRREEIPEEYHYKNHRLVHEIVVVAQPHFHLQGLQSSKQIPRRNLNNPPGPGAHGYANMTDMRTIFFARGPDFKKGVVHPPIHMVDEYQIFAELLQIPPQPNNGSWSKVSGMLINSSISVSSTNPLMTLFFVPLLFLRNIL